MRCRRFTFGNFRPLPSFPCNHTRPTDAPGQPHQSGPPHPLRRLRPTRPPCFADAARGPRRLMRAGLALILLGHLNLLLGAVLHGTVLRHVANPRGAVTSEYTTANVISVGSGLLVSAAGGPGRGREQRRPSTAGQRLVSSTECFRGTCGPLGVQEPSSPTTGLLDPWVPLDQDPGHTDCHFDPTRIYDTALALWIPSLLMSAVEAALSGYCCVAALTLRGVGPCRKEGLQGQLEELTELGPPKCKRRENEQLLDQNQEIQASQESLV
ncbi:keratinocyte-associated protein 3 isoform X2 [Cynocephalus volans]|uniref:keratinocyte-associated protein 3 isoform X2 n=1 Tax=Cynocephalus volans TaxID=110931 RepID=UPI002FC5DA96